MCRGGSEEEGLALCYSDCKDVVWVKPLKITKAGIISRHFISLKNLQSLNFTALVYVSSDFQLVLICKIFKEILKGIKRIFDTLVLFTSNIWQGKHYSFILISA